MLENGDYINVDKVVGDVSIDVRTMDFNFHRVVTQDNLFAFSGTKPYIVNLNQIECLVGEWNKDKTEYGLRIFYASGNSVWIGHEAANELLAYLSDRIGAEEPTHLGRAVKQLRNK